MIFTIFYKKIIDEFFEQREHWFLWVPVFIAIGIILKFYNYISYLPNFFELVFCLAAYLVINRINKASAYIVIIISLIILGYSSASIRMDKIDSTPLLKSDMRFVHVTGKITDIENKNNYQRFILEDLKIGNVVKDGLKLQINVYKLEEVFNIGDVISATAYLKKLKAKSIPEDFDYGLYLKKKGIGGTGSIMSNITLVKSSNKLIKFDNFKNKLFYLTEKNIKDKNIRSVVNALLTGERGQISKDNWEVIRSSGIAHLLAISGLHIGLIAGFIFFLTRQLMACSEYVTLHYPIKKIAAFLTILLLILYLIFIGSPTSAIRAVIMTSIILIAIILDREALSLRLVMIVASLMLVIKPDNLFDVGFQMSFAAVIGLIKFYEMTKEYWSDILTEAGFIKRIFVYLYGCLATTFIASTITMPFGLYHFHEIPLLSGLITNLIAVPIAGFWVMPTAIIVYITSSSELANYAVQFMGYGIGFILEIANKVNDLNITSFKFAIMPGAFIACFSLSLIWIVNWRGYLSVFGVCPLILSFLLLLNIEKPDILVSSNGKLIALRNNDSYIFPNKSEYFTRESWVKLFNANPDNIKYWDRDVIDNLNCDDSACIYTIKDRKISLIINPLVVYIYCDIVDVIIAPKLVVNKNKCRADLIIDRQNLIDNKGYSVYFKN